MYLNFIISNTLQLVMEFVYKGRCDIVFSNIDLFSAMSEKFELNGISESLDSVNSPEGSEQKADIVGVVDKNSIKQTDSSFTREINKLALTMRSVGYDRNLANPDNLSWNHGPLKNNNVDIIIVTKDHQKIGAHKYVLSGGSNFFRLKIYKDISQNMMCLDFITRETLQLVMDYIYTGKCEVGLNDLDIFAAMSDSLQYIRIIINKSLVI